MSKKKTYLSDEDRALWQKVQQSIDPLAEKHKSDQGADEEDFAVLFEESQRSEDQVASRSDSGQTAGSGPKRQQSASAQDQSQSKTQKLQQYNKREARKLASGRHMIEATLDLHGLTQREALSQLTHFLQISQSAGKRHLLVITGKGQKRPSHERAFELGAPEPGVLKQQVPLWLDDLSSLVLSYTTANIRHGGEGALYVRLRKRKTDK